MKTIKMALAAALISGLSLSALSLQASARPYQNQKDYPLAPSLYEFNHSVNGG
jgi:hypothetical protein